MSSGKFFGGSRRPVRRMVRGKGKVLAGYQGLIRGAPTPKTNPVLSKRDRFHSEVLKYIPEINEFFPRYLRYALTTRLTRIWSTGLSQTLAILICLPRPQTFFVVKS